MLLNHWLSRGVFGIREEQNDGGDGGGGDGGGGDDVQSKIDAATAGLKANNAAILKEKKELQTQLTEMSSLFESLGGKEGVERLKTLNEQVANDELGRLWKEGKLDEYRDKVSASMRKDHEKQMEAANKRADDEKAARESAERKLHTMVLKAEVQAAAVESEVRSSAIADIVAIAGMDFVFDGENDRFVLRDSEGAVVYGKDGVTPKTIPEWLDDQKEARPHWWEPSVSGGASGSGSSVTRTGYSDDPAEYIRQRQKERNGK